MANGEENNLVVTFRADKQKNDAASKAAGRPIFEDIELCEIRVAGDRNSVKVFPAHAFHAWSTDAITGDQEAITYAMKWNDQYRRFKEGRQQVQDGTPLEELPFLTEAKRAELKALSIYTAETLAALDGSNLKTLGLGGRGLKDQAQAYLDNANGSANVTNMAATIADLQQQIADLRADKGGAPTPPPEPVAEVVTEPADDDTTTANEPSDFANWSAGDLKAFIKDETGSAPRGTPSLETLIRMADDIEASKKAD